MANKIPSWREVYGTPNAYNPDTRAQAQAYNALHAQEMSGTGIATSEGVPYAIQRANELAMEAQAAEAARQQALRDAKQASAYPLTIGIPRALQEAQARYRANNPELVKSRANLLNNTKENG